MLYIKVGDEVKKGQMLTDGSADLADLFKFAGKEIAQNYIISEINRVYELQGATISRKHIEVIIKQMFSRRKIKETGDTQFTVGEVLELHRLEAEQLRVKEAGGDPAVAEPLVFGITEVSLTRGSFLSAASFQHTTKILIRAAVAGAKDYLVGLKENVIIGRLIPAGTGFEGSPKHALIKTLQESPERIEMPVGREASTK